MPPLEIGEIDAKAISLELSLSIMTARVFLFVCHANMFHIFAHKTNKYCVYRKCRKAIAVAAPPSLPPTLTFPSARCAAATLASKPQTHCKLTPAGVARQKFMCCDRQTDTVTHTQSHTHIHTHTRVRVYIFDIITRKYAANVNIFAKLS